jgi:hypothetical protein
MNRMGLLFLPFVSSQADAYPSRHYRSHAGHHHKHFNRHLAYQRAGEVALRMMGEASALQVISPWKRRLMRSATKALPGLTPAPALVRGRPAAHIAIAAVA